MKKLTAGIFATLLAVVSAGDANAKIASQAYVDQEVGAVEATVTQVQKNVTNVTEQVTQVKEQVTEITTPGTGLVDVVGDAEGGLVKDVADLGTDIGNTESLATTSKEVVGAINEVEGRVDTAEGEIDELQSSVAGKADQSALTSGLALKEDTKNKTAKITEENEGSATLFPTIGAITEWTAQEISGLSELPPNPDLMEDGTLPGSKLESGAITTDKIAADAVTADQIAAGAVGTEQIADGAVTGDKLGEELSAEIAGKADAENVYAKDETYTKTETEDKIKELGLPRPTADCVSDSNLCVLSVNETGNLAWVSVTSPLE